MKIKLAITGLCLTAALTALCACSKSSTPSAQSDYDAYGMGAVSTVRLLGSETSVRAVSSFSAATRAADGSEQAPVEDEAKAQAKKFNEYFTALDSFMGEDIVSTVSEANTDENYDYENKLTINGRDFNGEAVQYVMYFSEALQQTETDEEDGEVESMYVLEGVMVIDGENYYLEGGRSFEQDSEETEHELIIRAYADPSDKTNYVQMEQGYSVENGETETEYVYSVIVGGELIEQTAVEFETEKKDGREEVEYELEFRQGEAKGRYVVEREVKNGETEIKVAYDIGGKQGEFKIREITGENGEKQYEYTFTDESVIVL